MNKITFPLSQGTRGATVADLQDVLQQCLERGVLLANDEPARRELSAALKRERTRQTYGGATTKLVARLQEDHRLQANGDVDKPTADAFNTLLQEWGLLDERTAPMFRVVTGSVRRGNAPLKGVAVRAQHHAEQNAIRLGDDSTEFSLDHYEGRGSRVFHHHDSLCIAAYGFLVAERLRSWHQEVSQRTQPALLDDFTPRGSADARPEQRPRRDPDAPMVARPRRARPIAMDHGQEGKSLFLTR